MAGNEDSNEEEQWLYGDSNSELESAHELAGATQKVSEKVDNIKASDEKDKEEKVAKDGSEEIPAQDTAMDHEMKDGDQQGDTGDSSADGARDLQPVQSSGDSKDEEEGEASPKEVGQIGGDDDEDDDDDSEDDIRVTIGDIKTAPPQYPNLNIKRGAMLSSGIDKLNKQQPGKFSIEEFESIGTINGIPAHEFSIDALEDKPWRKPGADITDYFNYGFNEDTWRAYCERQKQMRIHESGVGLGGLGVSRTNTSLTIINENSKYTGMNSMNNNSGPGMPGGVPMSGAPTPPIMAPGAVGAVHPPGVAPGRKAGPPPIPRRSGVIEVIGGGGIASRRTNDSPPKESPIQVMTSDRRDYGRKSFDMSIPPPGFDGPPPINPVMTNYPPHGYNQDFHSYEMEHYYSGYEPTQDLQWSSQVRSSRHREKRSSRGSSLNPENSKRLKSEIYLHSNNTLSKDDASLNVKSDLSSDKSFSKERERERERAERHKDRHRHRSRSRSVERERRSRKHKSRSRSPGHRSHKKKKSKKSDRKDAGSD